MKKVSLILIFYGDKIVLFKRSNKNKYFKNLYGLIGGLKKQDETPLECVKRELFEETNLIIDNIRYLNNYRYYDKQINVYVGEIFDLALIKLNNEHIEYKLFNEVELDSEIVINTTKISFNDFKKSASRTAMFFK